MFAYGLDGSAGARGTLASWSRMKWNDVNSHDEHGDLEEVGDAFGEVATAIEQTRQMSEALVSDIGSIVSESRAAAERMAGAEARARQSSDCVSYLVSTGGAATSSPSREAPAGVARHAR